MKPSTIVSALLLTTLFFVIISCGEHENKEQKGKYLKGTISISGAFALYPMTVMWAEEFQKIHPKVRIDISAGGAGKGMTDALSGMVDLGMFSREVSVEEINQGAWYIAVTRDAVLPTVNAKNPFLADILKKGLKQEDFMQIFLEDRPHNWSDYFNGSSPQGINVYTRSDACGAAEMWGKYLGKNQESLNGVGVYGDPGMADAIKNDRYGIGFNNVVYAYDMKSRLKNEGLEIVTIDLNGNSIIDRDEQLYANLDTIMVAIQAGTYPSPPARDLYFVSKGQPTDPLVIQFIIWILKEGQDFVKEAGYVNLSPEKIEQEISRLQVE